MKTHFYPLILVASILTPLAVSAEDAKLAAEAKAPATPADAAWAELEGLMKGPSEQPKTQEEAKPIYKKHIESLDEKAAAFRKAYPMDTRRWKLSVNEVQTAGVRNFVGLPPMSEADQKKLLASVLAAPDADKESKGFASFFQVMQAKADEANFQKLAEAHIAAYPEFRGNGQLKSQLGKFASEKKLKTEPLELKYTATNGTEVDLAKMRGKVVLVDFWATWCGPCMSEVPKVVETYKKLHGKGFEIVGISFDQDKVKLESVTKEKEMTWVQYFDGKGWQNEFGQKFGIDSIPRMWLVNKKGMVVDTEAREGLAEKVEKLLAE